MNLGVLGISHKSSSLSLREEIAKIAHRSFLPEENVVPLLTCNRTEIYFSADNLAEMQQRLMRLLEHSQEPCLYTFFGSECFMHLATVTAGLDSAIVGETDIQRQVKIAYGRAAQGQKLSSDLHFLFQKCLKMGKWVRSSLPLYTALPTIEGTIYRLTQELDFHPSSVLFVGYSEINRKIISYFRRKNVNKLTLCTRNPLAAESFALDHGISLDDWSILSNWHQYDLIICATFHDRFLITAGKEKMETRLIFDLSVPRVVDPNLCFPDFWLDRAVPGRRSARSHWEPDTANPETGWRSRATQQNLMLWNIDDLASVMEKSNQEAWQAKKEIESITKRYVELFHAKRRTPVCS